MGQDYGIPRKDRAEAFHGRKEKDGHPDKKSFSRTSYDTCSENPTRKSRHPAGEDEGPRVPQNRGIPHPPEPRQTVTPPTTPWLPSYHPPSSVPRSFALIRSAQCHPSTAHRPGPPYFVPPQHCPTVHRLPSSVIRPLTSDL
jgi:hypothetical protein